MALGENRNKRRRRHKWRALNRIKWPPEAAREDKEEIRTKFKGLGFRSVNGRGHVNVKTNLVAMMSSEPERESYGFFQLSSYLGISGGGDYLFGNGGKERQMRDKATRKVRRELQRPNFAFAFQQE